MKIDDLAEQLAQINAKHYQSVSSVFDKLIDRFFETHPEITALGVEPECGEYRTSFLDGVEVYVSKHKFNEGEDENFSFPASYDDRFGGDYFLWFGSILFEQFSSALEVWHSDSSIILFRNDAEDSPYTLVVIPRV